MACSTVEINDLPDEVLCHIFSNLNIEHIVKSVINVCQRWRTVVAENKVFWSNIQLVVDCDYFFDCSHLHNKLVSFHQISESNMYIGEKDLEKVPKVQNIKFVEGARSISQSEKLLIAILDTISKSCQNVEKVEFSSCFAAASNRVMRFLKDKYSNIEELSFGINRADIYRFPLDEVSRFTNLKTLVLHDQKFRSSDLYLLGEECEQLSSLWVILCSSLKIDDIVFFIDKKKDILKELGIGIVQDAILDKLKQCHNLEVFFATDAKDVTDDCLKSFAHQSSLKYCSLHKARFMWTTVVEVAAPLRKPDYFKHLMILDLTNYCHYDAQSVMFGPFVISRKDSRIDNYNRDSNCTKSKSIVKLTFNNPYGSSMFHPQHSPDSQEHWMYRHRIT